MNVMNHEDPEAPKSASDRRVAPAGRRGCRLLDSAESGEYAGAAGFSGFAEEARRRRVFRQVLAMDPGNDEARNLLERAEGE